MAKNNNLTDFLTGVADAIRTKKGTTDLINPQDFESEIASIKTEKPEQAKSVTIAENGTTEVTPDSGKVLSKVTVTTNVQPTLQEKTVTPTTSQQIVTADSGKYGLSKVIVSAIQTEEKTQSAGTSNIVVTPTSGKYLTKVTVQPTPTETKTVIPTTAAQTITPTSGKYISKINVGAVTAEIDSNIVADNIKKDVTILGVTGTLESGGTPPITEKEYFVKVIDYDGTVLLETKGNTGDVIDLPTAPTHDKLIFEEWSASVGVTNNQVTIADNDVMVGAIYTTASGQSEFDITLTKVTGLSVTLNMDGTKDWGDGSSDTATTHTYTAYGDYTIKCNGTTMTTSNTSGLFGQSSSAINYSCVRVRLANITSIGGYALHYCTSLTNITIPSSVTSIGEYAFDSCYSLTSISIPSSVTSLGTNSFFRCCALTSISIPDGVTSIGNGVFSGCSALTSITIPSSVTSIGNGVFGSCYTLSNIRIPDGVTSLGNGVFGYCFSLSNIRIPDGVTSLGDGMFDGCHLLTNITIPDGVTSIGEWAFNSCYSLTNIRIPDGVTSISSGAFYLCSALTSITIPDGVTSLGSMAFDLCTSLTSISIPSSVRYIELQAFADCYSLTKYDFSKCTSVPGLPSDDVFDKINGICKIIVPDNLYDSWKTATNWSTYADYIYKASEV